MSPYLDYFPCLLSSYDDEAEQKIKDAGGEKPEAVQEKKGKINNYFGSLRDIIYSIAEKDKAVT